MEVDGHGGGPEHPVAGAVMLKRADQADRHDRYAELLREAETAVLEFVHVAVAGALGFGKNDEAGATIDGVLREPPHALDVGGAAYIRYGNIAKTLHEPAVGGDLKMRLELPTTDKLRDGAIEDEGIEEVDVINHEEAGALGVKVGRTDYFDTGAGK